MKIYAIIYYSETMPDEYDYEIYHNYGYYATKEIALKHLASKVEESKNDIAFSEAYKEARYDERKELSEAYVNGATFEYIPRPNEQSMWLGDKYHPFAVYDEDWQEWLADWLTRYRSYNSEMSYANYLYKRYANTDRVSCYFTIKEIEVIDA